MKIVSNSAKLGDSRTKVSGIKLSNMMHFGCRETRLTQADSTFGSNDEDADMEDDDDDAPPKTRPAKNPSANEGHARAARGVSSLPNDGGLAGPVRLDLATIRDRLNR